MNGHDTHVVAPHLYGWDPGSEFPRPVAATEVTESLRPDGSKPQQLNELVVGKLRETGKSMVSKAQFCFLLVGHFLGYILKIPLCVLGHSCYQFTGCFVTHIVIYLILKLQMSTS